MDTALFLTTSLKPSCQWILWVLNWLALSSKLCWISNLKMHEMNEWNTYKKWSLKRKEKSPLRKENVWWEKQASKKFVLIREINKVDLRPSLSFSPTNNSGSVFTFIVRVTVLTVQTIVPHPHVCPSLPIAELNAEINTNISSTFRYQFT